MKVFILRNNTEEDWRAQEYAWEVNAFAERIISYSTYTRKSDAKRGALRFMRRVSKAVEKGVVFED